MEENNEKKATIEQYSCKVPRDVKEQLAELMGSGDFKTQGQMIQTLVENYYEPRKVDKANAESVKTLSAKIADYESDLNLMISEVNEEKTKNASLSAEIETLKSTIEQLQKEAETRQSQTLPPTFTVVPTDQFQRFVLEYVAKRENKERKRNDITPEIIFAYMLDKFLIEGDMFCIDSVSDKVLKQLRQTVEAGGGVC